MLKLKKGMIAWEYIAVVVIILLVIVIFAMMSLDIRKKIIEYVTSLFEGTFWG